MALRRCRIWKITFSIRMCRGERLRSSYCDSIIYVRTAQAASETLGLNRSDCDFLLLVSRGRPAGVTTAIGPRRQTDISG